MSLSTPPMMDRTKLLACSASSKVARLHLLRTWLVINLAAPGDCRK